MATISRVINATKPEFLAILQERQAELEAEADNPRLLQQVRRAAEAEAKGVGFAIAAVTDWADAPNGATAAGAKPAT